GLVAGPDEHGRRPAEPVGGERRERHVALDAPRQGRRQPGGGLGDGPAGGGGAGPAGGGRRGHAAGTGSRSAPASPAAPRAERSHSSGSEVMSPAPRVTTRSPGRVSSGRRVRRSARFGR